MNERERYEEAVRRAKHARSELERADAAVRSWQEFKLKCVRDCREAEDEERKARRAYRATLPRGA